MADNHVPITGKSSTTTVTGSSLPPKKPIRCGRLTKNLKNTLGKIEKQLIASGIINEDANKITMYDKQFNRLIVRNNDKAMMALRSKRCHLRYPMGLIVF